MDRFYLLFNPTLVKTVFLNKFYIKNIKQASHTNYLNLITSLRNSSIDPILNSLSNNNPSCDNLRRVVLYWSPQINDGLPQS